MHMLCGSRPVRNRGRGTSGRAVAVLWVAICTAAIACGGRGDDASPEPAPVAPDLTGHRIMLLPVRVPAPESLDAALETWLTDLHPSTEWLLPAELQAAADRAPAWRLRLSRIERPVADVGGGARRITDPLYGALRQLGAVVDADYALVPVAVTATDPDAAGERLDVTVALVDIRGGRVLWMHTARAEGNPDADTTVATVAEAVARSLVR